MFIQAFLAAFAIIAVAELGDKTQLITLGFATKYPRWEVLSAVMAAAAVLMALAVVFGQAIIRYIPGLYIQLAAGLIFVGFGLWSIIAKEEAEEKAAGGKSRHPFWIVFSGFFLAELGDKTQIAAFALAAQYGSPLAVWLGATLGEFFVNFVSCWAGGWLKQHVPAKAIKWAGALLFIGFGIWTLGGLVFSQL